MPQQIFVLPILDLRAAKIFRERNLIDNARKASGDICGLIIGENGIGTRLEGIDFD